MKRPVHHAKHDTHEYGNLPVQAEHRCASAGKCFRGLEASAACSASDSERLAMLRRHVLHERIVVFVKNGFLEGRECGTHGNLRICLCTREQGYDTMSCTNLPVA